MKKSEFENLIEDDKLRFLMGRQIPMKFLPETERILAICDDREGFMKYIAVYTYGYIQGKRAERARRKKGGNHE